MDEKARRRRISAHSGFVLRASATARSPHSVDNPNENKAVANTANTPDCGWRVIGGWADRRQVVVSGRRLLNMSKDDQGQIEGSKVRSKSAVTLFKLFF